VDRLLLKTTPVLLGHGVKVFEGHSSEPTGFDLVGTERFDSGVLFAEYRRAASSSLPGRGEEV
jgi:hypothetical protein